MNTMQLGVVTLLKSAITQQGYRLPEDFDLDEACKVMQRHSMLPLLYEGAVLCGISKQLPTMQRLFQRYCGDLLISEGQMREISRICAAFDENGIDYLLLKGSKMKALYPKPELRSMGDADILIRMEQYDRIVPIMEQLGFVAGAESDYDMQWSKKTLFVELHKRPISSQNKDFFAYFGDGWKLAKKQTTTRYAMTAEDEMAYLFTHFAKHYRGGGIGCRHMLDLWVFLRSNPAMDEEQVKAKLGQMHLREFYENIRQTIGVWFEDSPSNEKTAFITDFVFDCGSWGKRENYITSVGVRDQSGTRGSRGARLKYVLRILFPNVVALHNKYTILKKAPWMLPLVWIYRPFYKLLVRRERKTIGAHKQNLQILSPEKISSRQQALEYVGLGYHF